MNIRILLILPSNIVSIIIGCPRISTNLILHKSKRIQIIKHTKKIHIFSRYVLHKRKLVQINEGGGGLQTQLFTRITIITLKIYWYIIQIGKANFNFKPTIYSINFRVCSKHKKKHNSNWLKTWENIECFLQYYFKHTPHSKIILLK